MEIEHTRNDIADRSGRVRSGHCLCSFREGIKSSMSKFFLTLSVLIEKKYSV